LCFFLKIESSNIFQTFSRDQCCKTFYGCNLQMSVKSESIAPGKPFQP
jgi:hypothetical protein